MKDLINLATVALIVAVILTAVLVYIDMLHYRWFLGAVIAALLVGGTARGIDEELPPK
jgi:hypothetical protein